MRLEKPIAFALAALTAFASAAPGFGDAAQRIVDTVQKTGQQVADYSTKFIPEKASTIEDKPAGKSLMKHKGHHKKQKHRTKPTAKRLTSAKVRRRLTNAHIIGNIIDDFVPSFILNVTYPTKHTPFLGQRMKPEAASEAPLVSLYPPFVRDSGSYSVDDSLPLNNIVVIMTDPDAPSRKNPEWGEVCHWIAVGLPVRVSSVGSKFVNEDVTLKEIMPYKPPGPPPGTHKHRYVLLAFTPANATSEPLNLVKPGDRKHWGYGVEGAGVKRWATEMGLIPIAGDFYRAKHHPTASAPEDL